MNGREIDFTTDKYNKPSYLSKRDSVAQIIQNGLFLKPGNLLSHPDRGVNIEQYIYQPSDSVDELKILSDLKNTCGEDLVGTELKSLTFQMITQDNLEFALILISISVDGTDDVMAISLQRKTDGLVHYDYRFINDDVPI